MKNKVLKYLLLLVLIIYPCVLFAVGCKDDDKNDNFVSISSKVEESIESVLEESSSMEVSEESSSVEEESSSSEEVIESTEQVKDEDESVSEDSFVEGEISQGKEHHFVTAGAQPDCKTDGFFKKWCDGCDLIEEDYIIPALGCTYKTVEGYSPTCKDVGQTECTYCTRCGEVTKEAEIIPTVGHNYTVGLGSCIWCDKSVLRYKIGERQDDNLMKQYYAICIGAEIFTPYSITRFIEIPDRVTLVESEGDNKGMVFENLPVIEIAEKAFFAAFDVNKLTIGANVEKIGAQAFEHCVNLREVYDKSQMRVGELAYTENGDITRYVKQKDIHYADDYTTKIKVYDDSGCITYTDGDMEELIGIRDTASHVIIPEGVTRISSFVFYKTLRIKALTIAESVKSIAQYAFAFDCEKHEEEGHTNEKCKFQLKTIIFLNPEGWRAYEYPDQNYMPFHPAELNETPTGAWKKLVMEYLKYHWERKEDYYNPYD